MMGRSRTGPAIAQPRDRRNGADAGPSRVPPNTAPRQPWVGGQQRVIPEAVIANETLRAHARSPTKLTRTGPRTSQRPTVNKRGAPMAPLRLNFPQSAVEGRHGADGASVKSPLHVTTKHILGTYGKFFNANS